MFIPLVIGAGLGIGLGVWISEKKKERRAIALKTKAEALAVEVFNKLAYLGLEPAMSRVEEVDMPFVVTVAETRLATARRIVQEIATV